LCKSSFLTTTTRHEMKQTFAYLTALVMSMSSADRVDELSEGCVLPTEPDSKLLLQRKNDTIRPLGSLVEEDATATTQAPHSDAACAKQFVKIMKYVSDTQKAQHGIRLPTRSSISLYAKGMLLLHKSQPVQSRNVLKDLEGIIAGEKKLVDLTQQARDELFQAEEKIAERMDVEQAIAIDRDLIITDECLQLLSGRQNADEDGENIVEGDIRLRDAHAVGLFQSSTLSFDYFPNPGKIPICFDPAISKGHRQTILHATQHYTDHVPCVGFVEVAPVVDKKKCSVTPGIWAQQSSYNSASLGASIAEDGPTLTLADVSLGKAVHELGHALGMVHTQARPDASQYVKIIRENIIEGKLHNFDTNMGADTSIPYDFMSVMHYPETAFQKRTGLKTIQEINPDPSKVMGQRMVLSKADAQQVAKMYGCPSHASGFKLCTTNLSHSGTEGECVCHRDPGKSAKRIFKATEYGRHWCAPHCDIFPWAGFEPCRCSVGYRYSDHYFPDLDALAYSCEPQQSCKDTDHGFCTTAKAMGHCNAEGDKNDGGSLYWQVRQKCSETCGFCRKCEDMHPECPLYKATCGHGKKWFGMEYDHVCRFTCHQC